MVTLMEIAHTQIQRPGKGEDDHIVRKLDGTGSVLLLAVADGLSLNDGRSAAKWVIDYLKQTNDVDSPRTIFGALKRELAQLRHQFDQSETTLTCGILRQVGAEEDAFLHFEYFAIGDSPIWKVVVGDLEHPFQRILIHGSPYPAEPARVYSTVRLHEGDISGVVTFGAVEVALGEVLVVCTDGIPEREVFVRDFGNPVGADESRPSLCRWLFQQSPYHDDKLADVLASYDQRGVLFDDATIITARLTPVPPIEAASHIELAPPLARELESGDRLSNIDPDGASASAQLNVDCAPDELGVETIKHSERESVTLPPGDQSSFSREDKPAPTPDGCPNVLKLESSYGGVGQPGEATGLNELQSASALQADGSEGSGEIERPAQDQTNIVDAVHPKPCEAPTVLTAKEPDSEAKPDNRKRRRDQRKSRK
jgi:serine/threonine protein phosphatase PrpC